MPKLSDAKAIYAGDTPATAMYLGADLVWESVRLYRDANGVTIKATPATPLGYSQEIDGVTYTVRAKTDITEANAATTCTSKITDMQRMFYFAFNFNGDISTWDTSNVTTMQEMFGIAEIFNGDISAWDTSNVTSMDSMFVEAFAFNSDISTWDTSNVTTMREMFSDASAFNSDISTWNTSSVTTMREMFAYASDFNRDLSGWNVLLIPDEPINFDTGAKAWTLPRPVWGTDGTLSN